MKKRWLSVLLGLSFYAAMPSSASAYDVPTNKIFTITFSDDVNVHTLQDDAIVIEDAQGNVVKGVSVALHEENPHEVYVIAPAEQYEPNSDYTLIIYRDVESTDGTALQQLTTLTFTTTDEENAFVVREESFNDVIYEGVTTTLPKHLEKSYVAADQQFTFEQREIGDVYPNELIIFPPTEEAPNGFAKKVVAVQELGGKIIVETAEPTYEEVVDTVDVSQKMFMTTDDFRFTDDVEARTVFGTSYEKVLKNKDGSKASIKLEDFKDSYGKAVGTKVIFKNFKYDLFDNGKYNTLDGSITFIRPALVLDMTKGNVNQLSFTTGFHLNFDKLLLTLDSFEKETKRVPLPLEVPAKFAGVIGGSINPYIEFSTKGAIEFGFEAGIETNVDIGFTHINDSWESFNRSTINPYTHLHTFSGSINGDLAAGVAIQAELLQFGLGGVEGAAYGSINASGNLSCYELTGSAGVRLSGFVGDYKNPILHLQAVDLSKSIGQAFVCSLRSIEADDMTIDVGKSKKLKVTGNKLTGGTVNLAFPDPLISFSSSNRDVAIVTRNGQVTIADTAKHGQTATITVTYKNLAGDSVETDVKVTVNEPSYVKPVEPSKPVEPTNPVEPPELVENKTYTIEEWGLTFELPEAVTNYTIEENYGYHIYNEEGHPMVYLYQYDKGADPSFRGYWSPLPSNSKYDYYIRSGFNIFFDDENSPYYDEQATVFNSIVKSAKLIK
ncbi:Ig-like domain-containing protein [Caryophanon latum]|uniref:SbsA Ig-like domain-containing protein n=1 Tax=Caryophanon latum TaxID=33977 RepID=A0A1C0YJF1_9BACL|nr:Ig-like domain-containing protein [Caryophanon latum]OCS87264.1 hypothetical protein A6K76_02525 [Caryophanon latum]